MHPRTDTYIDGLSESNYLHDISAIVPVEPNVSRLKEGMPG